MCFFNAKRQIMSESRYIFGIHPVIEALKTSENIDKVFLIRDIKPEIRKEILQLALKSSIPVQFVPAEKMKRLIPSGNHQGVVAVVSPIVFSEIEPLVPWWFENGLTPIVVALDEVTDVRNFGAISRTAECAGVNALLIPWKNSAQINAQTVKTSAGALYNIPLCRSKNLFHSLQYLKQSGFQVIACSEKASDLYTEVSYEQPTVFVFGSEEYGIGEEILRMSDHIVKIPLHGTVGSLNVSVATGIVLYEAVRQRN